MLKVDYASCENCYSRGYNLEGEAYEFRAGLMVRVRVSGRDDYGEYFDDYLYTGRDGRDGVPVCFEDSDAERLRGRIEDAGHIDPKYWWNCDRQYANDYPDYVINPHRAEYN